MPQTGGLSADAGTGFFCPQHTGQRPDVFKRARGGPAGMMEVGPFILAAERLAAILLIGAFLGFASIIGRRSGAPAGDLAWAAILAGVIAARLTYVAIHYEAFLPEPWAILAVWQGGFTPWAGVLAGIAFILIARKSSRPAIALSGGAAFLFLVSIITGNVLERRQQVPFPAGMTVETLQGTEVHLGTLKGQPFVVNLWASWCGPCRREMPMLIDVAVASSVPVLMINQGETAEQAVRYLEREGLPADMILLDADQRLSAGLGSRALPITVFVDARGNIRKRHVGEISRAALLEGIERIEQATD